MRSISTLPIFTLLIICMACSNKSKTAGDRVSEIQSPAVNSTNPTQTQTSDPVPINNSVTANSAGLNPAHGEPGHRCDIAVGSPLNGKPANQPEVKNIQVVQPPVIDKPS